jgi:signal transduction histidine kinase
MSALVGVGWLIAALLGLGCLELRRRLELVARAEHELRGPLTAVVLGIEALVAGAHRPGPPRSSTVDRAAALEAEVGRLRLSLADLQAARRGRRATRRCGAVSLEEAVRASTASWEGPARRAGRQLALDWRAGSVTLHADRDRVSQVLGNVLANALEHGEGPVRVRGRTTPSGVRVEVADEGPGFAATPRPARRAGRGRGLAVAQQAAREAGGDLRVESDERGATVALELPARPE